MKTKLLKIALFVICANSNIIKAQNEITQFKKTQKEILNLIQLPNPTFNPNSIQKLMTPKEIADLGFEQVYGNISKKFIMRDGKKMFSYVYQNNSEVTVILLHGILSSAYLMNKTAGLLKEATLSEVIALDFRGHGQSEGTPGDVDYINQYVDDLEDVILTVKKEQPNQKIILAGHSMGGGVILRYAMKKNNPKIDGYLLFAPHLGVNSPTINTDNSDDNFLKLHLNRIIGLKMLNAIGDTTQNHLPVLFFNLPETMPITKYTYRANESMVPLDFKKGLKAINKPLLVVVGSNDEAFKAAQFKAAVRNNSKGEVAIIKGETHNGVRHHQKTMELISLWTKKHNLQQNNL